MLFQPIIAIDWPYHPQRKPFRLRRERPRSRPILPHDPTRVTRDHSRKSPSLFNIPPKTDAVITHNSTLPPTRPHLYSQNGTSPSHRATAGQPKKWSMIWSTITIRTNRALDWIAFVGRCWIAGGTSIRLRAISGSCSVGVGDRGRKNGLSRRWKSIIYYTQLATLSFSLSSLHLCVYIGLFLKVVVTEYEIFFSGFSSFHLFCFVDIARVPSSKLTTQD